MEIPALNNAISEMHTVTYAYSAAATVVLYDTILNIPREIEFIWKRRWSFAKVLYLFCRYYGTMMIIINFFTYSRVQESLSRCRLFLYFIVTGESVVLQFVINMISIMRLYALYGRSRKFLYTVLFLFAAEAAGELFVAIKLSGSSADSIMIVPHGIPLTSCLVTGEEDVYTTCLWVLVLAFSSLLFFLMLIKYMEGLKKARLLGGAGAERLSLTPMLKAFYTSGTIWYFTLTAVIIVYAAVFYSFDGLLRITVIPWLAVVQSVSGSRLILDIRESDQLDRVSGQDLVSTVADPGVLVFKRRQASSFTSTFLDLEA